MSFLLICFPNFGVLTSVLEQSALTQQKYYLPPASYLENKWRSFFCRTEPQWPSLSLILHIFHCKCFLFSQILQQQKHLPCVYCFQWIQMNVEGRDFCCCTKGTDQDRHSMPLLFLTLHANSVSSSKQQCMGVLRLAYFISEDFPLHFCWLFCVLPFLPFTSYSPSVFQPRKTRHSSHKHPSINCLPYKPLIS